MGIKWNHDDNRSTEGTTNQKGLPRDYKNKRIDQVAELALERLLEAPNERQQELRTNYKERQASALINPLREDQSTHIPWPSLEFEKAVVTMMASDQREQIYCELVKAIDPKTDRFSHPPVVYLALSGGGAERFIGLLPWVRESIRRHEGIDPSAEGAKLEARVWGVDLPNAVQTAAFIQNYSRLAEHHENYPGLLPQVAKALIQRSGVLQVEAALHRAAKVLESLNPPAIWANHPEKMAAREAGTRYVQAVEHFIPKQYREMAADLAAIAWNRDRMAQYGSVATGAALTPRSLVGITLRTAIVNLVGVEALRGLEKEVIVCADPGKEPKAVKTSFGKIMEALQFNSEFCKDSPHPRFLKTVVAHSRSCSSGTSLLATAWREIIPDFRASALTDLSWIEACVLQFAKPIAPQVRGGNDAIGREILESALVQYQRVTDGSLPLRVVGSKGVIRPARQDGRGFSKIGRTEIAGLLHLSEILAGIPWTEKQKLRDVS
jgi:hypothetical protein